MFLRPSSYVRKGKRGEQSRRCTDARVEEAKSNRLTEWCRSRCWALQRKRSQIIIMSLFLPLSKLSERKSVYMKYGRDYEVGLTRRGSRLRLGSGINAKRRNAGEVNAFPSDRPTNRPIQIWERREKSYTWHAWGKIDATVIYICFIFFPKIWLIWSISTALHSRCYLIPLSTVSDGFLAEKD